MKHATTTPSSVSLVNTTRRQKNMFYGTLIILAAVCIIAGAFRNQITTQLNVWAVLPPTHTDPLTELYFTDGTKLSHTYTPGKTQAVRFTIHNAQDHTFDYRYEIDEQDTDGTSTSVLATGSLTLASGRSSTITTAIIPIDIPYHNHAKIKVELTNAQLSIAYLVSKAL